MALRTARARACKVTSAAHLRALSGCRSMDLQGTRLFQLRTIRTCAGFTALTRTGGRCCYGQGEDEHLPKRTTHR